MCVALTPWATAVPDFFTLLSDEVVLHIFGFLDRRTLVNCSAVCMHWATLAYVGGFFFRMRPPPLLSSVVLTNPTSRGGELGETIPFGNW